MNLEYFLQCTYLAWPKEAIALALITILTVVINISSKARYSSFLV